MAQTIFQPKNGLPEIKPLDGFFMLRPFLLIFIASMPGGILLHRISVPWPGTQTECVVFLRVPVGGLSKDTERAAWQPAGAGRHSLHVTLLGSSALPGSECQDCSSPFRSIHYCSVIKRMQY